MQDTPHIFISPQMRLDLPIDFLPNDYLIKSSQEDRASILNGGGANPNVLPNEDPIPGMIQEMGDLNVEGEARGGAPAAPQDPKIYCSACWKHFEQANEDPFAAVRKAERKFRRVVPKAAGVPPGSRSPSRTIGNDNEAHLNRLKNEAYNSSIYKELLDKNKFMFWFTAQSSSISGLVDKAKQELAKLYSTNTDINCVLIFVSSHAKLPQSLKLKPEFDVTIDEHGRPAIWIGKFLDEIDDQKRIDYLQKIGKLALKLRNSLVDINRTINAVVEPELENFVTCLVNVMDNEE